MFNFLRPRTCSFAALIIFLCFFTAGCNEAAQKENAVSLYVDAITLAETDQQDLAIEKLQQAVKNDPEFAIAYSLLGDIYFQQQNYPQSASVLEKATQLNPWSIEDFENLGKVYRAMNDFTAAANAYIKACQIDPENYPAHLGAAEAYYQSQDFENALQYSRAAIDINPVDSDIHKLLGDIYSAGKDNEMAIDAYKRALEIKGNDPAIMVPLAVSYLRDAQYAVAGELLNNTIAIDEQNSDAWRHLGFASLRLNNIDSAIEQYSKAVQIAPEDYKNTKGLGVAYMMKSRSLALGDPSAEEYKQKALQQWSRSLDMNPAQAQLLKLYRKHSR